MKFLYFWTEICIRQKDKPVICGNQESYENVPGTGGVGEELSGTGRRKIMSARKIKHTFERMKNYFQFVPYRLADMLEVLKTYPVKGFRMIFLKTFHLIWRLSWAEDNSTRTRRLRKSFSPPPQLPKIM